MRAVSTLALALLFPAWAHAQSGIPAPNQSLATVTPTGRTALVVPGGGGPSLADRGVLIEVLVVDALEVPVAGYPAADIWLDGAVPAELAICPGGTIADAATDADGVTTFGGSLSAGGWTQTGLQVYLAGVPLERPALELFANGPDLDANGVVDLADFGSFAEDFLGAYQFRSDLVEDGVLDLRDVGEFAAHFGATCP